MFYIRFDSSYDRKKDFETAIGVKQVIKGIIYVPIPDDTYINSSV
jgi:hypothetical protein